MKTHSKDYYKLLGVAESSTPEEIKKAYRKLAIETHPDRNPNDSLSEERFKEITEAYGVLMDPLKRKEYDRFRSGFGGGAGGGPQFSYSQQEIFENMFRQAFGRDAFHDLNAEFQKSGFQSGTGFFEKMLFSGAAGKIGRLLRMIPGPIGKIGTGLWLLQSLGTSIYTYRKSQAGKKDTSSKDKPNEDPSLMGSVKNLFGKTQTGEPDLNIQFHITIPAVEAAAGTRKQISYKIGQQNERLMVYIPAGIESGGKLRVKEKGHPKNGKRGDLILTVNVAA